LNIDFQQEISERELIDNVREEYSDHRKCDENAKEYTPYSKAYRTN